MQTARAWADVMLLPRKPLWPDLRNVWFPNLRYVVAKR